jgi:hypothetical protein
LPRIEVTHAVRAGKDGSQRVRSPAWPARAASEVPDASKGHARRESARAGVEAEGMNGTALPVYPLRRRGNTLDLLDAAAAMGPRRWGGKKEKEDVGIEAIVGGAVRTCAGLP